MGFRNLQKQLENIDYLSFIFSASFVTKNASSAYFLLELLTRPLVSFEWKSRILAVVPTPDTEICSLRTAVGKYLKISKSFSIKYSFNYTKQVISRSNVFHPHFSIPKVNIQLQNGHGVLGRLVFMHLRFVQRPSVVKIGHNQGQNGQNFAQAHVICQNSTQIFDPEGQSIPP